MAWLVVGLVTVSEPLQISAGKRRGREGESEKRE